MRLLVDLDGVLGNLSKKWITDVNHKFGSNLSTEQDQIKTWHWYEEVKAEPKQIFDIISAPGYYDDVEVMPGAVEVLTRLHAAGHEVLIVTSSGPGTLTSKSGWLKKHFPFLKWDDVIVTSKKYLVNGDVLLDDNSETNLSDWKKKNRYGLAVAMAAGYNTDWDGGPRVADWHEFEQMLNMYTTSQSNLDEYIGCHTTNRSEIIKAMTTAEDIRAGKMVW